MRIVVYTGTSLSQEEARRILEADYRPPVKRNDIKRLLGEGVDIIGIIDGIFFDRAAVAHREIIEALDMGIIVVGGSSMGALRAAELDSYGMIGVGRIYEWYKQGILESDDEVAVTFNPDTLAPLSIPLVNVRVTLEAVYSEGLINSEEREKLIGVARRIFYPDRSYSSILGKGVEGGVISGELKSLLLDFIREREVDVKREDAVLVLEKIKELGHLKDPRYEEAELEEED